MGQNPQEELVDVRRQGLRGGARESGRQHHWVPGHGIVKYRRWPRYWTLYDRGGGGGAASRGRGRRGRRPMKARRKASSFQTACFPFLLAKRCTASHDRRSEVLEEFHIFSALLTFVSVKQEVLGNTRTMGHTQVMAIA
ncbi:hypothetical protein E2C01_058754 [Portunus trituberculatus]|uniref:Uncharacterized protein n=1 Tax=Portunus trituberculatus TaxID=210409 RepID=A0A5B7H422_PORTR|nr:hypothetical protein [Portunus trituberculatus]